MVATEFLSLNRDKNSEISNHFHNPTMETFSCIFCNLLFTLYLFHSRLLSANNREPRAMELLENIIRAPIFFQIIPFGLQLAVVLFDIENVNWIYIFSSGVFF